MFLKALFSCSVQLYSSQKDPETKADCFISQNCVLDNTQQWLIEYQPESDISIYVSSVLTRYIHVSCILITHLKVVIGP